MHSRLHPLVPFFVDNEYLLTSAAFALLSLIGGAGQSVLHAEVMDFRHRRRSIFAMSQFVPYRKLFGVCSVGSTTVCLCCDVCGNTEMDQQTR